MEAAWAKKNRKRKLAIGHRSYLKRKPQILSRRRAAYAKDPGRRQYMERWFAAHPGYSNANTKAWRRRHPDRARATDAQMAAKRRAAPGIVTAADWARIVLFYGHRCGQCKRKRPLTVDHFIPLAKGGHHDWTNVWPLCLPCNFKKHTTVPATAAPPHVAVLQRTAVAT